MECGEGGRYPPQVLRASSGDQWDPPPPPQCPCWDGTVISVFQRREWRLRGTFWSPPCRAEPRKALKSANWLRMLGKWLVLSKPLFPHLSNGNRNWTCPLGRLREPSARSCTDFISLFLTQREKQPEGKVSAPTLGPNWETIQRQAGGKKDLGLPRAPSHFLANVCETPVS